MELRITNGKKTSIRNYSKNSNSDGQKARSMRIRNYDHAMVNCESFVERTNLII